MEYFTKWVEAIPLKKATGPAVANFIREHIICRFGIPHKIISNNGTPFVNKDVRKLLNIATSSTESLLLTIPKAMAKRRQLIEYC